MKPNLPVILIAVFTLSFAADLHATTRLDEIMQTLDEKGADPIKSYTVQSEYKAVDIHLDPAFWNGVDADGQQQLGDMMAKWDFLSRMNLVIAHLYVNSTEVGTITPNSFGGGYSFSRK